MSAPPSSGMTKPKPFATLNHFTFPVGKSNSRKLSNFHDHVINVAASKEGEARSPPGPEASSKRAIFRSIMHACFLKQPRTPDARLDRQSVSR